jgi:hypothetical protein
MMGYDSLHGDALVNQVKAQFNLDIMEPEVFDNWPAAVNRLIELWWSSGAHSLRDLTAGADIRVTEGNDYAGTRMLVYNYAGEENTLEAILIDAGYGFHTTCSAVTEDNYTRECSVVSRGDQVARIKDWRLIRKEDQATMAERRHSRFARLCRGLGDPAYQQWAAAPEGEGAPEGAPAVVQGREVLEGEPSDHSSDDTIHTNARGRNAPAALVVRRRARTARPPAPYRNGVNGPLRALSKAELIARRDELIARRDEIDSELIQREVEAQTRAAKEEAERTYKRRHDELEAMDKEREDKAKEREDQAKEREDQAEAKAQEAEAVRVKAQKRMDALAPVAVAFRAAAALAEPDEE